MGRLFARLIAAIWWIWIVIAATGVASIIGLLATHFIFREHYLEATATFGVIGLISGMFWAERVRRRVGLDKFFGALTGAPTKDQNMRREHY